VTPALILEDILVWSLQIGVLIAAASLFPPLLRLKMPKAKLAFRQLVLVACLLLPFVRSWKQELVAGMVTVSTAVVSVAQAPAARGFPKVSLAALVLALGAAGILFRLGLLLSGFLRLRRYRRRSQPLESAGPQSSWSVEADLRISAEIASPVTFGFRKPVVLLPTRFPALGEGMRDAILCHEILHVRRHDWLFTAVEEFVRAVLWFHPAVWWLIRDIQLVREQTVDREVVEMTRARDQYIDALLVIAGAPPQIDLAPAPLFLRKRHLKQRVVSILKEGPMSKAKSLSALAASLAMLAASGWFITGVFPLQAAPQEVADAPGVSVETGGAQLMHRQPVSYPPDAIAKGVRGTVVAQVKLDAAGNVTDASVVSGPEELRKAVLQSVLNWHFTSDAAFSTRQVSVSFDAPKADAQIAVPGRPVPSLVAPPVMLKTINVTGLSDQQRDRLLAQLPVHEGDSVDGAMIRQVAETLRAFDEHLSFRIVGNALNISTPEAPRAVAPSAPAPPGAGGGVGGGVQTVPQALHIGGNIQQVNLLTKVMPVYPPLAKAAHVEGTVSFEATIGPDGAIQNLQVVSGPPLLVQAAIEGVRQWVYKPTLLNGNPVSVITTIDVNFTLAQ
jgi:TonB family protein